MWRRMALASLALATVLVARPVRAAGTAPVVIDAAQAPAASMPTYAGPGGAPVPIGACGQVIGGQLWVLPCDDPRVTDAARVVAQTALVGSARAVRARGGAPGHLLAGAVILLGGCAVGAVCETCCARRRGPWGGGRHGA